MKQKGMTAADHLAILVVSIILCLLVHVVYMALS